jgi:hypothetical protein
MRESLNRVKSRNWGRGARAMSEDFKSENRREVMRFVLVVFAVSAAVLCAASVFINYTVALVH